jgi:hypothetical protein
MAAIDLALNAGFAIFHLAVGRIGFVLMAKSKESKGNVDAARLKQESERPNLLSPEVARAELLTLLRLLVREPPPDHNFQTCPTCKRYGITSI